MDSQQQPRDEKETAERLTARFAVLWSEYRRLVEEKSALESSTAWALAQRLTRWRRLLAPEGSRRRACLRLLLRGLRRGRHQETGIGPRSTSEETSAQTQNDGEAARPASQALPDGTVPTPAEATDKFRVVFIGSRWSFDAATMRYRAHNLIEALSLAGLEGTFVAQQDVPSQLSAILSHDLIVLVRRVRDDVITALIGMARRRGLPVVFDIDDFIFEPWIMPYVEAFHEPIGRAKYLSLMDDLGACLDQCDYFTGSTSYLAERVSAHGKESFVIHNGLNSTQLLQSQLAREQRQHHRSGQGTRIGYFSGTRTHQADFRIVYPAVMRLLHEHRDVRLTIGGQLDLGAFPGLAPFQNQIDILPICHWTELPAVIAGVDINLIPLELTPFNEGKSNLKYYEAGLVEVPSIASPTGIHCESITHGHNGLLARTTEDWYDGLKELIARPDWRRQMGKNALEHVMQHYSPAAIAAEAVGVYRQILRQHRDRRALRKQTLSIVLLVADPKAEWQPALRRANELAAMGHSVTVHLLPGKTLKSPAVLEKSISRLFLETLFTVRHGGEVPCCDVLIAVDLLAANVAKANQHRARVTIADADRLSMLLEIGGGLESLLRDWVQNGTAALASSHAA
jgi:glycosyltransferase involved in cell wall biosynthesis